MNETTVQTLPIQPVRTLAIGRILFAGRHERYTAETRGEIGALWGEFGPLIDSVPNKVGNNAYGIVWDAFSKGPYFEYMCAVEVSSADNLLEGFETYEAGDLSYAVFEHRGHVSTFCQTLDRIYKEWYPTVSGGYSPEYPGPNFIEVYGRDFDPITASGVVEVWVPIP
jgi:AraC family transcriptional regulator